VHPRALEPRSFRHIWRGGSLPPGYSKQEIIRRCKRVQFTLFCCISVELFFSCSDSAAVPRQQPGHLEEVPAKKTSGAAGFGLGTTIKYPRCTTGAATGNSLGTLLFFLRGAAGNGRAQRSSPCEKERAPPWAAAWAPRYMSPALRQTTSAAGGNGLGTTSNFLQRTTSSAASDNRAQRPSTCDAQRAAPQATAWAA
jgi:hypothetical protein